MKEIANTVPIIAHGHKQEMENVKMLVIMKLVGMMTTISLFTRNQITFVDNTIVQLTGQVMESATTSVTTKNVSMTKAIALIQVIHIALGTVTYKWQETVNVKQLARTQLANGIKRIAIITVPQNAQNSFYKMKM